jgi:hypothetical protein
MTLGSVVAVVVVGDVAAGADAAGADVVGGSVAAGDRVDEAGAVAGVGSGATTGTVVVGVVEVLDAAAPARTPTPATPPAAMSSVMLPTRTHPASRFAGVRGALFTPAILAGPRKSWMAGR